MAKSINIIKTNENSLTQRSTSYLNFVKKIKQIPTLYLILGIFGFILTIIVIANHYFFRTYSLDYAAYNFAFYDYSHFRISPNPIYWVEMMGNNSFLQDHLSYFFFLLIPFYWILTPFFGTYTLLIIQNGLILWGGWAVYMLVKEKTKNALLSNFSLLLYFLTYGRYSAFTMDVNLVIMLASIVPVYLYYFEIRNFFVSLLLLTIILTGRENMAIWLAFVFLVQLIWNKKDIKAIKWLLFFLVLSTVYFFIAFYILIPYVQSNDHPYSLFTYSAIGNNPIEAALFLFKHPIQSFKLLFVNQSDNPEFDGVKIEFYYVYFLSGGFILLFRPYYLLFFIPVIMQKMYNDGQVRWGIDLYYSIEIVTLLPIAVFLTIDKLKSKNQKVYASAIVLFLAVGMTIHKSDLGNRVLKWYNSEKYKFYDPQMYTADFDVSAVHRLLDLLPKNASVSAGDFIAPHLAFRDSIYVYPRVENAEYIALLTNRVSVYYTPAIYYKLLNDKLFSGDWSVIIDEFPLLIIQNKIFKAESDFDNDSISALGENHSIHQIYSNKEYLLEKNNNPIELVSKMRVYPSDRIRIQFLAEQYEDNIKIEMNEPSDLYFVGEYTDSLSNNAFKQVIIDLTISENLKQPFLSIKIAPSKSNISLNELKISHLTKH